MFCGTEKHVPKLVRHRMPKNNVGGCIHALRQCPNPVIKNHNMRAAMSER